MIKLQREVEVQLHTFLTSGVPKGVWGCSNPPPRNSEVLTMLHLIAN